MKSKLMRFLLKWTICLVFEHRVNPGHYIDSHGEHDSLSYCERCGEYDVSGKPVKPKKTKCTLTVPKA